MYKRQVHVVTVRIDDAAAHVQGVRAFGSTLVLPPWGVTGLKDNRLLPKGWNPNHPDAEHTGVYGAALDDGDFVDGADTVTYEVRAPAESGPYQIRAAFLYQTLSPRFAAELFKFETAEVETLERYYAASGSPPETMAELEHALE